MSQITKINGIPIANTSVSAFTYNDANTFTIYQNNGVNFSSSINSVTGLTFDGDATFNNGSIINPDYIDFNVNYTGNTTVEGRMYWDEPNGTISLGMHGGNVLQQIGLEQYYYIKNQSGTTIQDGRVVRAAGVLGASARILGEYMIADGSIPAKYTLGIATEDIVNGGDGYVTEFGVVRGINTTGSLYGETWVDGEILYVSPTIPGGLTKVEPSTPNLKIEMAIVLNAATNGSIFVRPNRYASIRDLADVRVSGVTNLDLIQYDSSLGYWITTNTPSLVSVSANTFYGTTFSGGTFYGNGSNLTGIPDYYVTGGTYSNGTLTLNRQNGTVTITGFSTGTTSTDTYVTGFTNSNGLLTISQNGGQSPLTADTTQTRLISFNSNDMALNTATRSTLTPLVMAITRFDGTGAVDDAGLSFIVPQDYLSTPEFYFTWRAATTSVNNAKISLDMYTGDTSDLGSLTSIIETMSITDTPTAANVFLYSPTVTPTTPIKGNDTIHLRIYRDPGDAGDTFTGTLDMINFVFRYKSKG